jgi:uncharacterized membrane protein (DUF106 family)
MRLSVAAVAPIATFIIIGVAIGIAFLNTLINRVLINYFVGWDQYRVMQKEMTEYRSETMKAMRANDKKQIEKLKKKEAQIKSMQAKQAKPQMVQFAISFLYIFVWLFGLTPFFGSNAVAYIPGITVVPIGAPGAAAGAINVIYWYPMCSFFFGLLASRILGLMPIE